MLPLNRLQHQPKCPIPNEENKNQVELQSRLGKEEILTQKNENSSQIYLSSIALRIISCRFNYIPGALKE